MPPVGLEPTIAVGERPYTYALDRAATGTGIPITYPKQFIFYWTNIYCKHLSSVIHDYASCFLFVGAVAAGHVCTQIV
jgi:hypothetical protein